MAKQKLMLIINPCSGRKLGEKMSSRVLNRFDEGDFDCKLFITQKSGDGTNFVLNHGADFDVIVCMGGDGTLNEVLNGILKSNLDVPLGYIPAGSTNDFADSMKLAKDPEKAVDNIIDSKIIKIDAGQFNDRYFSYVASFGAFTKTSYSTPQNMKNHLGRFSYFIEGAKSLNDIHAEHKIIEVNGEKLEGDYIFGAISNSKSIGGLVKYDDNIVDISDGMLEMMLIKKPDTPANLCSVLYSINHKEYDNPYIQFRRSDKFIIKSETESDWSLDGEFAHGPNEILISCVKNKINFICPKSR